MILIQFNLIKFIIFLKKVFKLDRRRGCNIRQKNVSAIHRTPKQVSKQKSEGTEEERGRRVNREEFEHGRFSWKGGKGPLRSREAQRGAFSLAATKRRRFSLRRSFFPPSRAIFRFHVCGNPSRRSLNHTLFVSRRVLSARKAVHRARNSHPSIRPVTLPILLPSPSVLIAVLPRLVAIPPDFYSSPPSLTRFRSRNVNG